MKTVRDFKNFVEKESGVSAPFGFCDLSPEHREFWAKLNKIGARNMESQPPETVPDIDATVELSEEEWKELEQEFRALPKTL